MTRILLDTNVVIRFFRGDEPFAKSIEAADMIVVHPVVYAEYMNGLDPKTANGKLMRRHFEEFLDAPPVALASVSTATSVFYSKIYRHLKSCGQMIPQNDIWLAATALENGYQIATHDEHFSLIPMLQLL